ncbi:DEAD/DEAH box helicase [Rhodococcus sp. BS-15]|uniref:DEAD/DEAH box helicase n=1 Tax=Rhodococcus sp. BS-15 TaxID=1304954 RepID=UPI000FFB7E2B|nr:AAA domain-containing protein [Rhodococcus sp. BS-15]
MLIEQRLSGLRRELEALQTAKQNLRRSLIAMLELSSDIKSEDLLKIAAVRAPIHDPRLDRLRVIQEDWRARFGTGYEFVGIVVAGSNVVAATCVGLAGVQGAENIDFDMCIIDEASKATATESLVPLAASKRWILVGDDRQLPPFVEDALNDPSILDQHNLSRDAVRETLFNVLLERLPLASKVALTHQHRMHPTIGRLISKCFYAGSLTSEPREASKIVGLGVSHPVTWFDTSNRPGRFEAADGNSYLNRDEVRVVVSILQRMQWVAERQKINVSVAVLTGYEPQRRILTESISAELTALSRLTVQVANIDAYQGQEADVAIFSVTRSNKKHAMGFLSVENRVNVALSRARDALVIVGDAEHIKASSGTQSALGKVLEHIASDSDSAVEDASSI